MKEDYIKTSQIVTQWDFSKNKNGRIYDNKSFEKEVQKIQKKLELIRKNDLRKAKLDSL